MPAGKITFEVDLSQPVESGQENDQRRGQASFELPANIMAEYTDYPTSILGL